MLIMFRDGLSVFLIAASHQSHVEGGNTQRNPQQHPTCNSYNEIDRTLIHWVRRPVCHKRASRKWITISYREILLKRLVDLIDHITHHDGYVFCKSPSDDSHVI